MDRKPWVNREMAGTQTMRNCIKTRLWGILKSRQRLLVPDCAAGKIEVILKAAETCAGQ